MAKIEDCPKRIYVSLDEEARNILIFHCKRTGQSKSQFICNLLRNSVDRQDILNLLKN